MKPIRAIDVVWFNLPTYIAGIAVAIAGASLAIVANGWVELLAAIAGAIAAWWTVASFAAAAWVFDRPQYGSLRWLSGISPHPGRVVNLTAGFDATTPLVSRVTSPERIEAIDVFDPNARHDGPLRRARRSRPPEGRSMQPGAGVDLEDGSFDLVTMVMSAHELGGPDVLARTLAEVSRCLRPDGRLVIAEFLRSPMTLAFFGPGALHFHSRNEWLETLERAHYLPLEERLITPFVGILVASPPSR